jgi:hypothetical protein
MATDIKTNPPSSTVGDAAHMMARAGLSAIPMIGGAGVELFSYLIVPPLTKRRDEWVQSIADESPAHPVKSLTSNCPAPGAHSTNVPKADIQFTLKLRR